MSNPMLNRLYLPRSCPYGVFVELKLPLKGADSAKIIVNLICHIVYPIEVGTDLSL